MYRRCSGPHNLYQYKINGTFYELTLRDNTYREKNVRISDFELAAWLSEKIKTEYPDYEVHYNKNLVVTDFDDDQVFSIEDHSTTHLNRIATSSSTTDMDYREREIRNHHGSRRYHIP